MLAVLLFLLALSTPSEQNPPVGLPLSPCPNVFNYEPKISKVRLASRWYGNIKLETDIELYSLWLTIILDRKADALGTNVGAVTTKDNMLYKIENSNLVIEPGKPANIRFYVQFSALGETPKLHVIRHNGKEICNSSKPLPAVIDLDLIPVTQSSVKPILITTVQTPSLNSVRPGQNQPGGVTINIPGQNQPNLLPNNNQVQNQPSGLDNRPNQTILDWLFNNNSELNLSSGININGPSHSQPGEVNISKPGLTQSGVNSYNPDPIVLDWSFNNNQGGKQPTFGVNNNNPGINQASGVNIYRPGQSNPNDNDDSPGGTIQIILPSRPQSTNTAINQQVEQIKCGTVASSALPLIVQGSPTVEGQWPWQVALYVAQGVNAVFICGGSLVSRRHAITAGHCVIKNRSKQVVEKESLMVYLGRHNLRFATRGMQLRSVKEIILYPDYNANNYMQDLAILEFWEPVQYTDIVRPVCLWPASLEDQRYIVGKYGAVVGWGEDESGTIVGSLNLVEMPVIDENTCLKSHAEFFTKFTSPFTYCAGYRNGTAVCNGDSGGGMVFRIGNTWYLRGLVSLAIAKPNQRHCDPSHFSIFTDLAKYLPWIQKYVYDY